MSTQKEQLNAAQSAEAVIPPCTDPEGHAPDLCDEGCDFQHCLWCGETLPAYVFAEFWAEENSRLAAWNKEVNIAIDPARAADYEETDEE